MHSTPTSRQAAVVYNPVKVDVDELKSLVHAAAEKHGWGDVAWFETTVEDPGLGQAKQAAEEGAEMVVACGGDGTVRAAAAGLRDTGASLGIIPQGTGNLLARNLSLPLEMEDAIDTVFGGQDTRIDTCTAELTRPDGSTESLDFVVMAGVGIDAQMIVNTDDDLKKKIGFLAYGVAIAKSLAGGNRIRVDYRLDGGARHRTRVHSLIIGNCGDLVASVPLLPDAQANDGIFDLVAIRPTGVFGWAQVFGKIGHQMWEKFRLRVLRRDERITGGDDDIKALQYVTGTRLEVTLKHPEVFEVDGDEAGEVTAFTITIDPESLVVREPVPEPVTEPGEPAPGTKKFDEDGQVAEHGDSA
ncbi:diacylglycerol/lipid kinase family protein [Corynebacterium suedekumii]|uniref:Diacylglycerol kinase family protein n=1 Tax=Corynebacterium suedekumii TaxID=3049801 RepID=A0ABY8VJE5_9CORY|nr:diacylglycerol kinase family protein [Corynebacterium suedekumii]WIM69689.1 diacylglycerol kinase family protein [Corynebacterium suedekumii]